MNLFVYQLVEALEDIQSDFSSRIIPKGSVGVIVEIYGNPEGYAVDFELSHTQEEDNQVYENVIVFLYQIKSIKESE